MRILGLDVGIASIGWGLVELERPEENSQKHGAIVACGVWTFDPPEEWTRDGALSKAQDSTRAARAGGEISRRRRQRMRLIRALFHRHGLLPSEDRDALRWTGPEPIALRRRALERAPRSGRACGGARPHCAPPGIQIQCGAPPTHGARRADARGQGHSAGPGFALPPRPSRRRSRRSSSVSPSRSAPSPATSPTPAPVPSSRAGHAPPGAAFPWSSFALWRGSTI